MKSLAEADGEQKDNREGARRCDASGGSVANTASQSPPGRHFYDDF